MLSGFLCAGFVVAFGFAFPQQLFSVQPPRLRASVVNSVFAVAFLLWPVAWCLWP